MKGVYLMSIPGLVKIGRTKDIVKRYISARTTSPDIILIGYLEVPLEYEKEIRRKFRHLRYKREWFYFSEEIISWFVNHLNWIQL